MTLRVVFMGSSEFSVPTLRALHKAFDVVGVFTQPDKPRGRGKKTLPTLVKSTALDMGLTVAEPARLTSNESAALLKEWAPDVIVVAAYGKILPESVLTLPPMGCVNLHASLLPRHRGASPISAAILAGDKVTGVCTIMMDKGMDTGDILLTKEIPILDDDTAGSLHGRLVEPGAELVVETLRRMIERSIEPQPQNHSEALYTRPLTKDDALVPWQEHAGYLGRLVRAMNPWPTAFSHLAGDVIKIWQAVPKEGKGMPGMIMALNADGIWVGTGKGLLRLVEVQAPGKKRMSAAEFARGRRLHEGDVFKESP